MTDIIEAAPSSAIPTSVPFRRTRGARDGFTIIELMLVLLLVTATATLSIWAYFARPEVTLDNAAQILVRDLRHAQARADVLHTPVSIVFAAGGKGYWIEDGAGEPGRRAHGLAPIERRFDRDAVFEGVTILPVGLGTEGRIVFLPSGSPRPSGKLVLAYERDTRTLELDTGDGRVGLAGH